MKPTYRRSWAGNLLMFSDLTLGPSFKVKRWFTGFGELSFRWIQIYIGSPMRRSSLHQFSNALRLVLVFCLRYCSEKMTTDLTILVLVAVVVIKVLCRAVKYRGLLIHKISAQFLLCIANCPIYSYILQYLGQAHPNRIYFCYARKI